MSSWKHISTAPRDRPFLVCGGEFESELYAPEPYSTPIKVVQERPGKFDCAETCGYSMWVNNPTSWHELPEVLVPPTQEFDL